MIVDYLLTVNWRGLNGNATHHFVTGALPDSIIIA
jgi:hypothetical protein